MQIERHTLDTVHAELTIHLDPADYNERFEKALKTYRKHANIPGFRPGHVPVALIRQRFGKSLLAEEINNVLQDAIASYIQENKLNVLGSPIPKESGETGNWDNPSNFSFTYELGLAPEIQVSLDNNLSIPFYKVIVDDEMVNRQARDYARRYGAMSTPETSNEDDLLMVRLHQLDDAGAVLEGGISSGTTLTIDHIKDESLKKELVGLSKDSSIDIDPHALTSDHEELAKMLGITHHDVHHLNGRFRATVEEIRRIAPAAFDQELFDKVFTPGEVTSEEEMRSKIKSDLEEMFARDSEWMFRRNLSRKLVETITIQLPDEFLKRWIAMTNEKPIDTETLEHEYPAYANSIRWQLIENTIIQQYNISVTTADAVDHVKGLLRDRFLSYGIPVEDDRLEEMAKETLGKRDEAKRIYDQLFEAKIADIAKEHCTIEEKAIPYEEFIQIAQH